MQIRSPLLCTHVRLPPASSHRFPLGELLIGPCASARVGGIHAVQSNTGNEAYKRVSSPLRIRLRRTILRNMNTISVRIREARDAKGWTQLDLARRMGLSEAYGPMQVSHWENDYKEPTPVNLLRLSDALGVSVDFLLKGNSR